MTLVRFIEDGKPLVGYVVRRDGDDLRVCTATGEYHTVNRYVAEEVR